VDEIEAALAALSDLRDSPSGTIRITTHDHAVRAVLWPALAKLLPEYPGIKVEIVVEYGLTDIVAARYDAGVRTGEMVGKDMIAVRIGPDLRSAVVGSPGYFARRPKPKKPQDLTEHIGINLRLPTHGGLYAWEFARGGREVRVRVDGQLVFNSSPPMLDAALAGCGLAYLPEDDVAEHIAMGRLVRVLADWCPPYPGYHLSYPSRRQPTSAFAVLVNALRYRG
jgi:DNA-binding transcriptional LysR family regulator